MTAERAYIIGQAIGKLVDRMVEKTAELSRRESSGGTSHNVRIMNRLREEIASLERRITSAEHLQDRELSNGM